MEGPRLGQSPGTWASKERLETLLRTGIDISTRYQSQLALSENMDRHFDRCLSVEETTKLHNQSMNDVKSGPMPPSHPPSPIAILAHYLWVGDHVGGPSSDPKPWASNERLETLIRKATEIRMRYQLQLALSDNMDRNLDRCLTAEETKKIHNLWMNDVKSWMSTECLQQYEKLLAKADEYDKGKGKGKKGEYDKGKGKGKKGTKGKGGAGKSAKGKSAGEPALEEGKGCRQKAQQLKKQCFNKVIGDIAVKKALFFSLVKASSLALESLCCVISDIAANKQSFFTFRAVLDALTQFNETDENELKKAFFFSFVKAPVYGQREEDDDEVVLGVLRASADPLPLTAGEWQGDAPAEAERGDVKEDPSQHKRRRLMVKTPPIDEDEEENVFNFGMGLEATERSPR